MESKIWHSAALFISARKPCQSIVLFRQSNVYPSRRGGGGGRSIIPGSTLLDFGDIQLQQVVQPCQQLLSEERPGLADRLHAFERPIVDKGEKPTLIHPWWGSDSRNRNPGGNDGGQIRDKIRRRADNGENCRRSGPPRWGLPVCVDGKQRGLF